MKNILVLLFFFVILPPAVRAQSCANTVSEAEALYNIGRFREAVTKLQACIDRKAFGYPERIQAYRIIAMSYLAVDSVAKADENIERLLLLKDNFEADARDPDRFRMQVLFIRQKLRANLISSVSKKAENIDLAPATIEIITHQDIINRGYRDLEALFADLPAFDINKTSGLSYSVLFQRGYRSAANTERTLLLVDGVPDNDLWSNSAFVTRQYPLSNIKRVEVIYGPASTIYGANAFVGVINIVTRNEEDYFQSDVSATTRKGVSLAVQGQAGGGSLNTKFGDLSVAGKHRNFFFALTGRTFHSDDVDLSAYPDWDGQWTADEFGPNRYLNVFSQPYSQKLDSLYNVYDPANLYHYVDAGLNKILPTAYAIKVADSLDQANYQNGYNGVLPRFSDRTKQYYLSGKFRVADFSMGFEYFNWTEGVAPDYIDKYYMVNSKLQNWQGRNGFFYIRYDKSLSERLNFSNQTSFKINDFGKESVVTRYYGYANAGLGFTDFIKGKQPYYLPNYFGVQSKQFRTETRLGYTINERFDVTGGLELRNGFFQGDYINSAAPDPLITGVLKDSILGGNFYSVFDVGAFTQLNYSNKEKRLNISVGGRFDYNSINGKFGYGSVFNPRIAVVYYPSNWILKAIYSEAFLDASVYNKFATSSARLLNNPQLEPERVKNIEASVRYVFNKQAHIELAYYHAFYTNILGTVNVDTNGIKTTQFQAIGKARIQGLQLSATYELNPAVSVYGNAWITDPKNIFQSRINGQDSSVRTGDITTFSANAGVNLSLLKKKLNFDLRMNYVGEKPTGKSTSIYGNPFDKIDGYVLFNSAVTYQIIPAVSVQVTVDNLLNTEYYSPGVRAASGVQSSRVPQGERFFMLKLITQIGN